MNTKQQPYCIDPVSHYRIDGEVFEYSEAPDPITAEFWERLHHAILNCIPQKENVHIIDIGSGSGWLSEKLKGTKTIVTSIDLSHKNLTRINKSTGLPVVVSSAERIPIASNSADYVVASEVIEHLNRPESAVNEFFRIIKPGGLVIITTPYKEKIRYYLCIHCNRMTPANAHLHSFDEQYLTKMFSDSGARQTEYRRIGNKGMLFLRIYYLLRWLPFPLWSLIDRAMNALVPKTVHIMIWGIK